MRIKRLEISGFGRWSQQNFDLIDGMQVIAGQNESGKTTLRAFIVGVLFGFPTKKGGVNVYDPKDGSQYGGSLILETDEGDVRITRLDRTKTTLNITRLVNQTEINDPEKWLKKKLSPLTRESFDDIFNFNQEDLSHISQIKSEDFQKLLLNIGAVGSTGWLDVMADLDKSADKLFAPRGNKRPLNMAIKDYENNALQIQQNSEALSDFISTEKKLTDLETKQQEQQNKILTINQALQERNKLIQQYQLFESAKKITIQDIQTVNETEVVKAQRLQIEIDALSNSINRHNATLQNIKLPEQLTDSKKEQLLLSQAQVRQRILSENQTKKNELLQQTKQLEERFTAHVPEPLTDKELQELATSNFYFYVSVIAVILVILSTFVLHLSMLWIGIIILVGCGGLYYKSQQQNKSKQAIKERYSPLDVVTIKAIQPQINLYEQHLSEIEKLDSDIIQQQDDVVNLIKPIAVRLDVEVLCDSLDLTIVQLITALQQQNLSTDNKRNLLVQQQNQIVVETQQEKEKLNSKIEEQNIVFKTYHVNDLNELEDLLSQFKKNLQFKQRYQDIMQQIDEETRQKLVRYESEEQLVAQQEQQKHELAILQEHAFKLQNEIANYKAQQEQRTSNDQFMTMQQNLANQKTELTQQFSDYLTLKLTVRWINKALQNASQNRFPKMQELATKYFKYLTNERYDKIQFSKNSLQVITIDSQKFDVTELSTGTQEQLYVAFRLALSQVIKDIISMPLLVDDGFVNFDDNRKKNVMHLLHDLAQEQQIIYWTAARDNDQFKNVIKL
ncbi:ATP-binding protein [Leuconostoc litchii]|uniref:DNA repair protein n=1 Tax=Leuconostoc litchii TaxID=1981069 RepID=A0A6P2CMG1_9LACO|nr:AAA family ATPase [Leuconostoc litchii]TYC47208.1 DNA repair protein [Leuconostoc litchii]